MPPAADGTADVREPEAAREPAAAGFRRLFAPWPGVAVEEAVLPSEPPPGPVEEAAQIANAAPSRRVEFAMVRHCARRAAARLGIPPFVLRNDENRAPIWPAGLVGALTHTGKVPGGYCAAAVARAQEVLTVGLDAEQADPLPSRLYRFVLTPQELEELQNLQGQGLAAKIIFSAKECFYKAQFPLTRRRLGFQDVEINLDFASQAFQVCPVDAASFGELFSPTWRGGFSVDGVLVRTALAVAR